MQPAISIITALYQPNLDYLLEAAESLFSLKGAKWEWLIQLEEDLIPLPEKIISHPQVYLKANGTKLGTATTRNQALVRSRFPLVMSLDGDDLLAASGVKALAKALEANPQAAYAFGPHQEFQAEEKKLVKIPYQTGLVEPGQVFEVWRLREGQGILGKIMPHPAGIMWRREYLFAYGGWRALSFSEDTALLMAVSESEVGVCINEAALCYRLHQAQTTAGDDYLANRFLNWEFIRLQTRYARAMR